MAGPDEPNRMCSAGAASASRMAREAASAIHGRRITVPAHRCHRRLSRSPAGRLRTFTASIFGPTAAIMAGRSVRAAADATVTASIAPHPIERNAAMFTSCVPASATTTVMAETNTAFPDEAMASGMASSSGWPCRSSSRYRVRMNSE